MYESAYGLLEWSFRIGAVAVKNIHIIEPKALETLVQAGEQRFSGTPLAVRTRPHAVTGLGRDNELIAVCAQVVF